MNFSPKRNRETTMKDTAMKKEEVKVMRNSRYVLSFGFGDIQSPDDCRHYLDAFADHLSRSNHCRKQGGERIGEIIVELEPPSGKKLTKVWAEFLGGGKCTVIPCGRLKSLKKAA